MRASGVLATVAVLALASGVVASMAGYGPLADATSEVPVQGDAARGGTPGAPGGGQSSDHDGGGDTGDGGDAGGDDDSSRRPFSIEVVSIEECGQTCRDVTLAVTNERNQTATDVAVHTGIFAGKQTDGEDEVWSDRARVGDLRPGDTVGLTGRVELGFVEAAAVKRADGWVTVRTTITSDGERATFVEEKQVA